MILYLLHTHHDPFLMFQESGDFSCYQLGRLLKRHSVQVSLEKAEKEMGGKVLRMNELQELMEAQGVNIIEDEGLLDSASHRIASDSSTRYVLCKGTSAILFHNTSEFDGFKIIQPFLTFHLLNLRACCISRFWKFSG